MNLLLSAALIGSIATFQPTTDEIAMPNPPAREISRVDYEVVKDSSGLALLNPDLQERKIAKIRLSNGLEALLISDPKADQSSAAVAVKAGSWNDPTEYPGMAHFCEHMLFMGTEKYPDCNAFFASVADAGGTMNAFTAPDRTVYMFSSKVEGFLSNLDRFAHFFIDPVFDPGHISRELHAVDQEFAKNLEHDGWREYMVFKELSNENHPNRNFTSGNAATLANIPQSALKEWHSAHYSANQMHLFIYSSLPIEQLKEEAASLFGAVPQSQANNSISYAPILSDDQRGQITYIKPIQNKQTLSLTWELPLELSDEKTKSADLIAYALNRGQEHSLYEYLKKEQLVDEIAIQSDDFGTKENGSFTISLELSPKGIVEYRRVIQLCFEAIAGLKQSGVPRYLFEEKNQITKLLYEYQSRQDAFQMAQKIGRTLPDEPLSTYPKERLLADGYSPEKIQAVLSLLTPDTCSVVLAASPSLTGVTPDRTEKWFGAEYAVRPVPKDWLASWKTAKPNIAIRVAEPNPFVPKELRSIAASSQDTLPTLLSETAKGVAYYCRAPEFLAPEASIHLYIHSPEIEASAKSAVLLSLYLDHLSDGLNPTITAAQSAGLTTRFDLDKLRLHIQIQGFSEKAPVLLNQILKKLSLLPPTREQFEIYTARHEKSYSNGSKELPVIQAKEMLDSLLVTDRSTQAQKLAALKAIRYEEFVKFQEKLLEKTYMEALFAGNLSFKQAESSWIDVQHAIGKKAYPKSEQARAKVLELPNQGGPFSVQMSTPLQGNGVFLAIDGGSFSFEKRSVQDVMGPVIREAFFNELRTKQKTGYIARSEPTEIEERLFQLFMVQSNSHQPEDLLYRFELFLEEYLETLTTSIPESRFKTLKNSAIHSIQTRFRNLRDKSALWALLAFEKGGDFQFLDKRIESLQTLSYDRFLKLNAEMLARSNLKRLAVLCEGRLAAPFAYEPIAPSKLLDIVQAGHALE